MSGLVVNPFVSEAQRRACYAKGDPSWDCKEWEKKTTKKLPERKKSRLVKNRRIFLKKRPRGREKAKPKGPSVKLLRIDPTRTITLRRHFVVNSGSNSRISRDR